jgi:hypothetical protein
MDTTPFTRALHRRDGEVLHVDRLDGAGDAAAGGHLAETCRRGFAYGRQRLAHVGRLEIEGDVGLRRGSVIVNHGAAHGEARGSEVGDLEVVQFERVALQADIGIEAADRLLLVDQLRDLGLEAKNRAPRDLGGGSRHGR